MGPNLRRSKLMLKSMLTFSVFSRKIVHCLGCCHSSWPLFGWKRASVVHDAYCDTLPRYVKCKLFSVAYRCLSGSEEWKISGAQILDDLFLQTLWDWNVFKLYIGELPAVASLLKEKLDNCQCHFCVVSPKKAFGGNDKNSLSQSLLFFWGWHYMFHKKSKV